MATRTYTRGNLNTLDPRHLAANIDTALARTGTTVDINGLNVIVTHPSLVAGDDATVNAQITAYTFDPTWGRAIQPYVFTINAPALLTMTNMPLAVTEVAGSRTRLPLYNAQYSRLTCHVTTAGAAAAVLRVQVSLDQATWVDGPQVAINTTGLKVSGLTAVPPAYQADVFFRLVTQGGDGVADPVVGLTTVQVA